MLKKKTLFLLLVILTLTSFDNADAPAGLKLALLKYNGGGDWYSNPTALPNLAKFCNRELGTNLDPDYAKQAQFAASVGVKSLCYSCRVSAQGIELSRTLPM